MSGPEPTASPELSTLVDVSIECSHGTQLGALPFDAGQIGFLSGNPDDTSWVTQVVTITNHADVHVAVTPGFTVRYVARDGATLGTASLDEPYPPAFTAAPDQTVHRNTVRFDLPGRGGLVPEPTLAAALYTDLAACGIDDEVTITPIAADEFIDPDLVDRTELVNCGLDATGSRYEGTLRVANSGDETLDVEFGFEILDGGGNRLGIGGNERDRVEASAQTDVVGWAATFTVVDPTQVQSCRLLALTAT